MMVYRLLFFVVLTAAVACKEKITTPKPRAYPRVEYPQKGFDTFDIVECPFTFSYPSYATYVAKQEGPCWFDLYMEAFDARIHCSYVPVKNAAHFDDLMRDAFVIADKINARANYMEEIPYRNRYGAGGLLMQWTGPAASQMHFFLTDTTQHFFKASLYFNSEVQPDSLAPIYKFVKTDIDSMMNSFQWRD